MAPPAQSTWMFTQGHTFRTGPSTHAIEAQRTGQVVAEATTGPLETNRNCPKQPNSAQFELPGLPQEPSQAEILTGRALKTTSPQEYRRTCTTRDPRAEAPETTSPQEYRRTSTVSQRPENYKSSGIQASLYHLRSHHSVNPGGKSNWTNQTVPPTHARSTQQWAA